MRDKTDERIGRYLDSALEGARQDVAGAAQGSRDARLLAAAMTLGALQGEGLAGDADAVALEAAGTAAGQPLARVRCTIRSGLARGRAKGRQALPAQLQELLEEQDRSGAAPPRARPAAPPPDKPPPPAAEVAELWGRALPVCDDPALCAELLARALDPAAITDADLARALPAGPLPRWAWSKGGSWRETGHRLLLGLHDALGALRSIHARTLRPELPEDLAKGLSPAGFSMKGLIFASSMGRDLLAAAPAWWNRETWIVEGAPDFLAAATHHSDAAEALPAVYGYLQGAWTEAHGARVPEGVRVLLFPHADAAGAELAARVAATLGQARVLYVNAAAVARG